MIKLELPEIIGDRIIFKLCKDVQSLGKAILVSGIDEAGRGPVIGPMVMVGYEVEAKRILRLLDLGVKDSKMLEPSTREQLFKKLLAEAQRVVIAIIPPKIIDEWVEKRGLNRLEAFVVSKLVDEYLYNSRYIFVDAPSTAKSFYDYIRRFLKERKYKIIAEPSADKYRPVVSAASIIAKVIRDQAIAVIKGVLGIDIGSGYPSDWRTRKFLGAVIERMPNAVRMSWKSVSKHVAEKN